MSNWMKTIESAIYDTNEMPGYMIFKKNKTDYEVGKEIRDMIPKGIKDRLDYAHTVDEHLASVLPGYGHGTREARLEASWEPGGNEGFYVTVKAVEREGVGRVVLTAKTFELEAAVKLHLFLMAILNDHGTLMKRGLQRISEAIERPLTKSSRATRRKEAR